MTIVSGASGFDAFFSTVTPLLPIPVFAVALPAIYLLFRSTWQQLDREAHETRAEALGKLDLRPLVALALAAVILTMQEYYGGRAFYEREVRTLLLSYEGSHPGRLQLLKYDELYSFGWWAGTRIFGYVAVPFPLWKLLFRKDSLLDFGLRSRGFLRHWWIYAVALVVVVPLTFLVSRQPEFNTYYPFYKTSSRSWFDLLLWEAMYFAQFFALELYFRGFWLGALKRSFGSGAIFAMAVPYCMIHYGKPYLEAMGAIIAGIFLGSLSMKTRSIYHGFLVHITVAGLMDALALAHRNALPKVFWPPG
ncbi:MAG: CPBP family intramembrane glutamic endopeptidase [Myxococcales bacterium]